MAEEEGVGVGVAAPGGAGGFGGDDDGLPGFQLEEEPETLLAPPEGYGGAIVDQMGGGEYGGFQEQMEDLAGLLISSDDESAGMDVDVGAAGGDASQEF